MSKKRMRRRMRRGKGRGDRTEFWIKFSELDRTLLFCYLFLPFPFLSLSASFSVAPLDCAHLSSRFSHSVRTRSFTSPARRCTFFSNPFLRYSTALNGRLLLPPADRREPASGRRSSSVLFRFYYKPFEGEEPTKLSYVEALC